MSDFKCNAGAVVARKSFGGGTQKHVMRTLVDLTQADGRITATIPEIAAAAEVSDRTVQTHLKAFVAAGLVRHVGEVGIYGRKHNVYSVDLSALKRLPDTDFHRSSKNTGEGNSPQKMPHRVKETPPTGEPVAVSPVKEIHPLNVEILSPTVELGLVESSPCATIEDRPPLIAVPVKVDWVKRLAEAQAVCEGALDFALGGDILTAKAFRDLCEPSSGIPCDWDLDVLPALTTTAQSFRRRKQKMRTWFPVREHVLANRDKRLAGNPEPKSQSELFQPFGVDATEQSNVSRIDSRGRSRSTSNTSRGGGGSGTISKNSLWGGASYSSRQPL